METQPPCRSFLSTAQGDEQAQIEFIEIWHPAFSTAAGVYPEMTLDEAEKRNGRVREIRMSEIEAREYAEFADHPPGLLFRLIHPTDTAGDYRRGENMSDRYRPGAAIFSIAVIGPDVMTDGGIGGIRIGATEDEVRSAVTGNPIKDEDVVWEAIGSAVQKWHFPESGLTLDMASDQVGGAKTVLSIFPD